MSETTNPGSPTVVLVHGAFADASSWNGVIARLQAEGVSVTAPANPLRGIAADSAYLASVLDLIDGPVLAVGHSYGGAVITNAATDAKNVVGLVYVAAFAPDEGELLGAVEAGSKDSVLNRALVPRLYPTADSSAYSSFMLRSSLTRLLAELPRHCDGASWQVSSGLGLSCQGGRVESDDSPISCANAARTNAVRPLKQSPR
jgi:pimeloyl-ACP methyl ester carboxylesterase